MRNPVRLAAAIAVIAAFVTVAAALAQPAPSPVLQAATATPDAMMMAQATATPDAMMMAQATATPAAMMGAATAMPGAMAPNTLPTTGSGSLWLPLLALAGLGLLAIGFGIGRARQPR